jgi:hypothetical protein
MPDSAAQIDAASVRLMLDTAHAQRETAVMSWSNRTGTVLHVIRRTPASRAGTPALLVRVVVSKRRGSPSLLGS